MMRSSSRMQMAKKKRQLAGTQSMYGGMRKHNKALKLHSKSMQQMKAGKVKKKRRGGRGMPTIPVSPNASNTNLPSGRGLGTPTATGGGGGGTGFGAGGLASIPSQPRFYGIQESLAEKKAQQAVEEKLELRREIKEISDRVERMVHNWEEEESRVASEFPAQFEEAQGNVRVLILNFEKLGLNRHQALDNLKTWFERLQVEGQQVEMEVEEEVGDKVLESRRSLARHDTAMDILDDKEAGVMSLRSRVAHAVGRCKNQLKDMSHVRSTDMHMQLQQLEQTLEEVGRLEEALEAKGIIENDQRGQIQVLRLKCESLEADLANAREMWSERADEYEVLINRLEREVVQAEVKLRKQEQNLRATEMELAAKDSKSKVPSGASTIRSFTSGEDTKDALKLAREKTKRLQKELREAAELAAARDEERKAELQNALEEKALLAKAHKLELAKELKLAKKEAQEQYETLQASVSEYQAQLTELNAELDTKAKSLQDMSKAQAQAEESLATMEGLKTELDALKRKNNKPRRTSMAEAASAATKALFEDRMAKQEARHREELARLVKDMEEEADARVGAILDAHRRDIMETASELNTLVRAANKEGGDAADVPFDVTMPTEHRARRRGSDVMRRARIRKRRSVVGGGGALAAEHMPVAGRRSRRSSAASVSSVSSRVSRASRVSGARSRRSSTGADVTTGRRRLRSATRRRRSATRDGGRGGTAGSAAHRRGSTTGFVVGDGGAAVAFVAGDDAEAMELAQVAAKLSAEPEGTRTPKAVAAAEEVAMKIAAAPSDAATASAGGADGGGAGTGTGTGTAADSGADRPTGGRGEGGGQATPSDAAAAAAAESKADVGTEGKEGKTSTSEDAPASSEQRATATPSSTTRNASSDATAAAAATLAERGAGARASGAGQTSAGAGAGAGARAGKGGTSATATPPSAETTGVRTEATKALRRVGTLSHWVHHVVAERLQPLVIRAAVLRMKARRAEAKNAALRTEVEQLTTKLESVVSRLEGGEGKAADAWPGDLQDAVDENSGLREVIRQQTDVLKDLREFLTAMGTPEAAALIARIDTVMGLAESIKHRPIPRLEPNEDELPLDADLSMLPLDKQVAHLQNIRKRLMDKMRAMEQSHLKQLQENSQFTGVPTSAGAATAAAAAAAATQQVAKVSTNLDTLHSGVGSLVDQVGKLVHGFVQRNDGSEAASVIQHNMRELDNITTRYNTTRSAQDAGSISTALLLDVDAISKVVMTLAAFHGSGGGQVVSVAAASTKPKGAGARATGHARNMSEKVAPPPAGPAAQPSQQVGQLEVAESAVKRSQDIDRMSNDLGQRQASLGEEVERLDAKLRNKNLDAGTRRALRMRRDKRQALLDVTSEHMSALQRERERNLLLVMNAFARVHKLAKTVFKGHIYRHLVSSMGGVQEHLHMRTVLQYDGELGIGPLPPLHGHGLLKKQPKPQPAQPVSFSTAVDPSFDVDTSWSYTVPVFGLDPSRLEEGHRLASTSPDAASRRPGDAMVPHTPLRVGGVRRSMAGGDGGSGGGGGGGGGGLSTPLRVPARSPIVSGSVASGGRRSHARNGSGFGGSGSGAGGGAGSGSGFGAGLHGASGNGGSGSGAGGGGGGGAEGGGVGDDIRQLELETSAVVGSGVAYDVAPMQHTPPPVFIKHDDNWGSTPPGFVTKERLQARSPVSEDRAVGGGWTPKRSAREQRRADSANFLARVTPSSRRHPGGTSGGAGSGGGGGGGGGVLGAVGGGLVEEGSVAGNVAQVGFSPSRRFRVQDGAGRKGRSRRERESGGASLPPLSSDRRGGFK